MKNGYKALNDNINPGPLGLHHATFMYNEFFITRDYDWWRPVLKGDIVVDVGACVGFFSCNALDLGASKVYMLEPNKELLKIAIQNSIEYVIDASECPIVPVNAAIGLNQSHFNNVFTNINKNETDIKFPIMTFNDFITKYEIDHIDYLKLDCEGGEYSILTKENLDWISKNVGHIAMEVHLRSDDTAPIEFIKFREEFLRPFLNKGQVKFMNHQLIENIEKDDAIINKNYSVVPAEFMMYITIK